MIRLTEVIETFEADLLAHYRHKLSADHYRALSAMKRCRTVTDHPIGAKP